MLDRSSSLAFRSFLKSAASKAGLSRRVPALSGLTPAMLAFHAAASVQDAPLVVVVSSDALVEQVVSDARFFLASIEGLGDRDARRLVLPFPSQEVDPYRGLVPHLEVASARARALHALASGKARLIVASARALLPRLSDPARLAETAISLAPGRDVSPYDLADRLALAGFAPEDPVDEHGEYCVRGGVVDIYPAAEAQPVRLEFVGDTIESVRRYDAATQRSLETLDQILIHPQRELLPEPGHEDDPERLDRTATAIDYVRRAGATLLVFEIDDAAERGRTLEDQWRASAEDMTSRGRQVPAFEDIALPWESLEAALAGASRVSELVVDDGHGGRAAVHVNCQPAAEHKGRIAEWVDRVRAARDQGEQTVFVAETLGRAERTVELLAEYDVRARQVHESDDLATVPVIVTTGDLSRGFSLPAVGLHLYAETDLFEEERRTHERRKSASRTFISDFRDLKIGDHVVHVDSGIGRFVGLKKLAVGGPGSAEQEFMELRYAGDDKLFVPLERLDLVQKYTGGAAPTLDKLGGATWEKAKTRVKKAMRDMAEELLKLYAARKAVAGHAFSADSHWQHEFDSAFPYDLTPDQDTAIAEITRDMEQPTPMDRLLCGDVGYGKTEVAMRAAFKAVIDGKQVAVLAPTTVLSFQHLRTLTERFAGFPVVIDLVSRFVSGARARGCAGQGLRRALVSPSNSA